MGPYYVTALVNILGPVKRVAAITTKAFEERVATSQGARGLKILVKTTTHLTGTLEFQNGAIITMIMSFDMWRHSLPCIEIYGETGSMTVPDPNGFGGPVHVCPAGGNWEEEEIHFPNNARMIGVIDMVSAIESGRAHRANGALAYHVLEVMCAFDKSSETGEHVFIESTTERPRTCTYRFERMGDRLESVDSCQYDFLSLRGMKNLSVFSSFQLSVIS